MGFTDFIPSGGSRFEIRNHQGGDETRADSLQKSERTSAWGSRIRARIDQLPRMGPEPALPLIWI
jgi:hypothetical protein